MTNDINSSIPSTRPWNCWIAGNQIASTSIPNYGIPVSVVSSVDIGHQMNNDVVNKQNISHLSFDLSQHQSQPHDLSIGTDMSTHYGHAIAPIGYGNYPTNYNQVQNSGATVNNAGAQITNHYIVPGHSHLVPQTYHQIIVPAPMPAHILNTQTTILNNGTDLRNITLPEEDDDNQVDRDLIEYSASISNSLTNNMNDSGSSPLQQTQESMQPNTFCREKIIYSNGNGNENNINIRWVFKFY